MSLILLFPFQMSKPRPAHMPLDELSALCAQTNPSRSRSLPPPDVLDLSQTASTLRDTPLMIDMHNGQGTFISFIYWAFIEIMDITRILDNSGSCHYSMNWFFLIGFRFALLIDWFSCTAVLIGYTNWLIWWTLLMDDFSIVLYQRKLLHFLLVFYHMRWYLTAKFFV